MRQLVAGLVVVLAGCGPVELQQADDATGQAAQGIVGGTLTQGDPAVVAIGARYSQTDYEPFCSGTLIAPKTVLTAAHCIYAEGRGDFYYVMFGPDSLTPTSRAHVKSQVRHPQYNGGTNDFGLIQLDDPVIGVTPIEPNDTPLTNAMVGQAVRHVGYGVTSGTSNDMRYKREVTFPLRQVSTATIESGATGKQTCGGDSGGPAFMKLAGSTVEKVVGVVSYGDEDCLYEGVDGRVDYAMSWIRSTMGTWEVATCAEDGRCVANCTPVDPDCACAADGQCTAACTNPARDPDCPKDCATNNICSVQACPIPDVDCVADGMSCSSVNQCQGRVCAGDPQNTASYCTRACTADGECSGGLSCLSGQCARPQKPTLQPFDRCSPNEFCGGGTICTGPTGGITRCVTPCPTGNECTAPAMCEGGSDGQRYCRPPSSQVAFTDVVLPLARGEGKAASGCASVGGGVWAMVALLRLLRRRHLNSSPR